MDTTNGFGNQMPSSNPGPGYGKTYMERRRSSMESEQSSFIPHWMDLTRYTQPRKGRYIWSDRNKGDKRWTAIINSKATKALQVARAGMLAGTMSPASPWFEWETHDPGLMNRPKVKQWLYDVAAIARKICDESNLYSAAPTMIGELLLFGTGAMSHVDDFENVARFTPHTIGSYMIAQDEKYNVNTFCRKFEWQVPQIVKAFGLKNVSQGIKNAWDRSNYDAWFPIVQFVEPNPNADQTRKQGKYKNFRSCYYEPGAAGPSKDMDTEFLSESGFDEFPVYCPRWETTGEDIYGTDCPGMTTLGDVKGLQMLERRGAQALDLVLHPLLKGPPSMRNVPLADLPGGLTVYEGDASKEGLSPIYQIQPQFGELRLSKKDIEDRVDDNYFVNLFMAISNQEGIQPQNQLYLTQVNEERLLQLGPVLEHVHREWLARMLERIFNQMLRAKILPPAPPELAGQTLRIRFVSSMARAQRAAVTNGIDRFTAFVGGLTKAGWQDASDKYNEDAAIDAYASGLGIPPSLVNSDDIVAAKRAAKAKMAQQQMQMQQLQQGAVAGANVGKTVQMLSDPNAQAALMGKTPGVANNAQEGK